MLASKAQVAELCNRLVVVPFTKIRPYNVGSMVWHVTCRSKFYCYRSRYRTASTLGAACRRVLPTHLLRHKSKVLLPRNFHLADP